jgi:uncharacterized protein (TIGR01370 family)
VQFNFVVILASLMFAGFSPAARPWAAYYSDRAQPGEFRGYGLVVFDSDRHPALRPILASGSTVLGYLSLCEVEQHRKWFATVTEAGFLAGENPNWPGTYFVDVRDARWRQMVVRKLVPEILAQGFQGLFLDTLDDAAELERRDPEKYRGMKAGAIELVKEIRRASPAATLMVNRGYDLLPELAGNIDIVLGESVYGTYDFTQKAYRQVPSGEYRQQVGFLTKLRSLTPTLRIFTLDYWDPADRDGLLRVYREERSHGFNPYVTTVALDQLTKEPR